MGYTLAQVRGYLKAIDKQRRAALLDSLHIARAAQADKAGYKAIRDELKRHGQ
jgi:hypothetical protein